MNSSHSIRAAAETGSLRDLVAKFYPFAYALVGKGNDDAVSVMQEELPFQVHEFPSGAELNGWQIPDECSLVRAEIRKDGELIYDGRSSPLGVISLTESFQGIVDLEELKRHVHYTNSDPDAIVFHCVQPYRPSGRTWGFCMPKTLFDGLQEGEYHVHIEVARRPSTLKVLEYVLPGAERESVILQAHNCHPFQANDDMSGVAVGIDVMKRLAELPVRRLTYRLLICPELTGTAFWLGSLGNDDRKFLKQVIILAAVGNDSPLKLQESFTGHAPVDRVSHHVFRHRYGNYTSGPFRTVYGNDETVFEAPGFEIPAVSLTRYPFPTYHTDRDTPASLSEDALRDSADTAFAICSALDKNYIPQSTHTGLICLSHERYDLYQRVWDPSDRTGPTSREHNRAFNLLMTLLPRLMDGKTGLIEIADRVGLPIGDVEQYVQKWVQVGLARVVNPTIPMND